VCASAWLSVLVANAVHTNAANTDAPLLAFRQIRNAAVLNNIASMVSTITDCSRANSNRLCPPSIQACAVSRLNCPLKQSAPSHAVRNSAT
jgi:hypothetical protein